MVCFYAIKNNEILPFVATWTDPKYKMLYDISCMLNLKYNANDSVYKRETDSKI